MKTKSRLRAAVSAALRALAHRAEADGAPEVAATISAAERALARNGPPRSRRDDDLLYLPYMAVYPGDDELA